MLAGRKRRKFCAVDAKKVNPCVVSDGSCFCPAVRSICLHSDRLGEDGRRLKTI